jgi:hypothetical protein
MPIKFKKSIVKATKSTDGTAIKQNEHYYMSCTSTAEIMRVYESTRIPKYKDKLKKELVRRGALNAAV